MKVYAVVEHIDNNESYPEDRWWKDETIQIFETKEKAIEFIRTYKPDENAYDMSEIEDGKNNLMKYYEEHKSEPIKGCGRYTYKDRYGSAETYASEMMEVIEDNRFTPDNEQNIIRTFWIGDGGMGETYTYEIKEWEVL